MLTTRRARALAAATAGLPVLLLALAGCGGDASVPPRGPLRDYVALGDSYSSGPGIAPVKDEDCNRSGANYASLFAAARDLKLQDMTCGGANTANLLKAQDDKDGATINEPQLAPIDATTDLVTLGIGLNDSGISGKTLYICLPSFAKEFGKACEQYLAQPDSAVVDDVSTIAGHVKLAIQAIRELSPSTRIALIGYPKTVPDTGDCPDRFALTGAALDRLRLTLKTLDAAFAKLAKDERVTYVSTYRLSDGHDLCSADPWVNGTVDLSTKGEGANLHPRPAYMEAVAAELERIYGAK